MLAWRCHEETGRLGGQDTSTYAVPGGYDLHVTSEICGADMTFQMARAIERHGLDTSTTRAILLDRIGGFTADESCRGRPLDGGRRYPTHPTPRHRLLARPTTPGPRRGPADHT